MAQASQASVLAYDVNEDGSLGSKRTFISIQPTDGRRFVPDGMTVDRFGNVYGADKAGPIQLETFVVPHQVDSLEGDALMAMTD